MSSSSSTVKRIDENDKRNDVGDKMCISIRRQGLLESQKFLLPLCHALPLQTRRQFVRSIAKNLFFFGPVKMKRKQKLIVSLDE